MVTGRKRFTDLDTPTKTQITLVVCVHVFVSMRETAVDKQFIIKLAQH